MDFVPAQAMGSENPDSVIVRPIDHSYALWFSQSKSFILLQEPAFEVYRLYMEGIPIRKIKSFCQKKFGHLEDDIPRFVSEIICCIRYYQNPKNARMVSKVHEVESLLTGQRFFSVVDYQMGKSFFRIRYQYEYLMHAIHPLISHLECATGKVPEQYIDCFEQNRLLILTCNGELVAAFPKKDFELYRGAVIQQIYSFIYGKDFSDWMMMLHSSGVVINQQAILFSAAGGSGKSTLAAILKAKGYSYLSDDMVAVDKNKNAFPYPAAISVKEGAVATLSEYYPELMSTGTKETINSKTVRYLSVFNLSDESTNGYPVHSVVFVNYSADQEYAFHQLSASEALPLILKETWVKPTADNVNRFFDWLQQTSFYRLRYSNTSEALKAVEKLVLL